MSINQRRSARLPIELEVEFNYQETGILSLRTKDISDTGVFIKLDGLGIAAFRRVGGNRAERPGNTQTGRQNHPGDYIFESSFHFRSPTQALRPGDQSILIL